MRVVWFAPFCALLLLVMAMPATISIDPNIDTPQEDLVTASSSGRSSSVDMLAWEWAHKAGGSSGDDSSNDIVVHSNGDVYVTGSFESTATFGNTILTSFGNDDVFVAKMNSTGHWLWAVHAGGNGNDIGMSVALDSSGNAFIAGKFQGTAQFGLDSMTAAGNAGDLFVAKISSNGVWQWVNGADSHPSGTDDSATSIAVDSNGYVYLTGFFQRDINFDSTTLTWAGMDDIFVAKIDTWGNWQWATMAGGAQGVDQANSIAIGPNGNVFITGYYQFTSAFGSNSLTSQGGRDAFLAKVSPQGNWIWSESMGGASDDTGNSIDVDSQGGVYASGYFYSTFTVGNISYGAGGSSDTFVVKASDQGSTMAWEWASRASSSSVNAGEALTLNSNGDLMVTGGFGGTISFGSTTLTSSGNKDVFVAKIDTNGTWGWATKASSGSDDVGLGIDTDAQGSLYVSGYFFQNTISFGTVNLATSGGFDAFVAKMSSDYDQDSVPDSLDSDDDGDFILDAFDGCNPSPFGFQSLASTDRDGDGCRDSDEDLDDDGDGVLDENDACPRGLTGWIPSNTTDIDMDGCLDAIEDYDDDNDGFEDYMDFCPREFGNSTYDYEGGCPDSDGDGRPDVKDPFPEDLNEWEDSDGDGIGNNSDAFPYDPTQALDSDRDGFGDYPFGNFPDSCPDVFGTSVVDYFGCVDSDEDGVSDINDRFPTDPELWQDSDEDGIEDDADAFPYNPTQWNDTDGDGFGDNPMGSSADKFVADDTQWHDVDGDGYGDNPNGNMPDAFPLDPTQWQDWDGDGHGDNPSGIMADAFPFESTQWIDEDNDGLGDNPNGNNPDPYPFDSDNDGYNNSIDPLPLYPTPGDRDNDGTPDGEDVFPDDITEWADWDGDGEGDNADNDDDNDNWDDWTEMREGTDSHDPNSHPKVAFEVFIPGTKIAFGAWDLIGVLGGVPVTFWLIFGFVTRNGRTEIFEERMRTAKTRPELEEVATEYERALMIRLIGPHQGIRLERVRAELDDEIEMSEAELTGEDEDDLGPVVTSPDQTEYTEEELGMQPPEDAEIIDDGKGYEWVDQGDEKWYRTAESSSWTRWET